MKSLSHWIVKRQNTPVKIDEKTVLFAAKQCIREEYGKRGEVSVTPDSYRKGALSLRITSSLWAGEFFQEKEHFRNRCNAMFSPQKPIKKIVILR